MKVGDLVQVTWVDAVESQEDGLAICRTVGYVSAITDDCITLQQTQVDADTTYPSIKMNIPRTAVQTSRALETGRKRSLKAK